MNWETVHRDLNTKLERFEVPGGWLYRSTQWADLDGVGVDPHDLGRTESMAFVPEGE